MVILNKSQPVRDQDTAGKLVHVVGGGGLGSEIFRLLIEQGMKVSTGVINIGDSDWQEAQRLGITIVEAAPFCPVTLEQTRQNSRLMLQAEYIILAAIPFGPGNISNLQSVLEQAQAGRQVIVVNNMDISKRDYTGGIATELYNKLIACGAAVVENAGEAVRLIKGDGFNDYKR